MIESDAAVQIARERAKEKGWAFAEPIKCVLRKSWLGRETRFEIETNADQRGTKARFVIDAQTGQILSEGYIPR